MDTKTILLVEDNPTDIALTRRALAKSPVPNNLVVVEDGADAIDYLYSTGSFAYRDPKQSPSLVLLDLNLPKVKGLEVLKKIRSEQSTRLMPVVIFTSSKEEQDILSCFESGANSYIRKSIDTDKYTEAILMFSMYWLSVNEPLPDVESAK